MVALLFRKEGSAKRHEGTSVCFPSVIGRHICDGAARHPRGSNCVLAETRPGTQSGRASGGDNLIVVVRRTSTVSCWRGVNLNARRGSVEK